ncbi:MAG TPA: hypothetical protein VFP72_18680 [Kineosporiaceae bacterium]|nr:hypothetical protein [Kineosporiaceae bacterium]
MSQATAVRATARPVGRPAARPVPAPPRLQVVSAPAHTRSRAGLVFACLALLTAGLVALLLLNVSLERGSYQLQAQQTKATQLQDRAQALQEELATLQAPQNLAQQAGKLGMVPNPNAAFLTSDGKVLGVPMKAAVPQPTTAETPPAKTSPTSATSAKPGAVAKPGAAAPGTAGAAQAPKPRH